MKKLPRSREFFFIRFFWRLGEETNKNDREEQAEESATDYLAHPVTDTFLKAWEFIFFDTERFDQHIEVAPLVA